MYVRTLRSADAAKVWVVTTADTGTAAIGPHKAELPLKPNQVFCAERCSKRRTLSLLASIAMEDRLGERFSFAGALFALWLELSETRRIGTARSNWQFSQVANGTFMMECKGSGANSTQLTTIT
jgi:hypothetical protein